MDALKVYERIQEAAPGQRKRGGRSFAISNQFLNPDWGKETSGREVKRPGQETHLAWLRLKGLESA